MTDLTALASPTEAASETAFGAALTAERARLLRLCARLTGYSAVAEDLVQETLFEAWRSREKLRNIAEMAPWLAAIARNVCLRWRRAQGRQYRLYHLHSDADDDTLDPLESAPADDADLSFQLERDELTNLLGRAMALLPAETREALVASYLDETPHHELAARLGLREGALRARLHRGRQMLRRVLEDDLRSDALGHGLLADEAPRWQPTRIWCPFCGVHHLTCWLDRETGAFQFRCAGACEPGIGGVVGSGDQPAAAERLTSPKALLSRQCLALGRTYRGMVAGVMERCPACGSPAQVARWQSEEDAPAPILLHGIRIDCPRCGPFDGATPWHLALDTPQAIQFWRRHPRMRARPIQTLEFAGRPAILTGFESATDRARLDIVAALDSLQVLHTAARE